LASNNLNKPTTKTNSFWESENDNTKASSLSSKPSLISSTGFNKKEEKKPEIKKQGSANSANGFWEFEEIGLDEDEDDKRVDYHNTNLNKLSKAELDKHKAKMEVGFSKNQKKPGDRDFVYDKQEEFDPQEENEWDEDIELDV